MPRSFQVLPVVPHSCRSDKDSQSKIKANEANRHVAIAEQFSSDYISFFSETRVQGNQIIDSEWKNDRVTSIKKINWHENDSF